MLAVSTSASAGYPDRNGTVAYWTFDEGSGTIAHDISGNGNDGNIYGAVWVDGKVGSALQYDGTDDYVLLGTTNLDPIFDAYKDWTVELWAKINAFTDEGIIFINRYHDVEIIRLMTTATLFPIMVIMNIFWGREFIQGISANGGISTDS